MSEKWKEIPGYDGDYQVSNLGRIRSFKKWNDGRKSRILKPSTNSYGYHFVMLSKNGKQTPKTIHRLIAKAFIPNPKNKRTINHKNGDKADNKIENLEWATYSENHKHAFKNGLRNHKGENSPLSKLTENNVLTIRAIPKWFGISQVEISRAFNVDPSHISDIIRRQRWAHI